MSTKQRVRERRTMNTGRAAIDVDVVADGGSAKPAVIMFAAIFGVNEPMKQQAARIAAPGFFNRVRSEVYDAVATRTAFDRATAGLRVA